MPKERDNDRYPQRRSDAIRVRAITLLFASGLAFSATADTLLSTDADDYEITQRLNSVRIFNISMELDALLAPGVYTDPVIRSVTYRVSGSLDVLTPSTFERFDLQRSISGTEYYAQGGSLSFEIDASAVLDDGVQVAELVGSGIVFSMDARELGTMRFHPPRLELNANGTGRIQNSSNIPSLDPRIEVESGAEYITDLVFDPGNTTLLTPGSPGTDDDSNNGGGGIPASTLGLLGLILLLRRSDLH